MDVLVGSANGRRRRVWSTSNQSKQEGRGEKGDGAGDEKDGSEGVTVRYDAGEEGGGYGQEAGTGAAEAADGGDAGSREEVAREGQDDCRESGVTERRHREAGDHGGVGIDEDGTGKGRHAEAGEEGDEAAGTEGGPAAADEDAGDAAAGEVADVGG